MVSLFDQFLRYVISQWHLYLDFELDRINDAGEWRLQYVGGHLEKVNYLLLLGLVMIYN